MNKNKHFGTIFYSLINITYFMAFCVIHAFAAVYLLDKGFSNMSVGVLLAVANVTSALLQPVVASIIDKYVKITNRICSMVSAAIIALGALLLLFVSQNQVAVFIIYTIIYMTQFTYMPVLTALNFEYQKKGCNIFFGLARGLGSAGFAVTSMFIGRAVERRGVDILLIAAIIIMAVHILLLYLFKEPAGQAEHSDASVSSDAQTGDSSPMTLMEFLKTYPSFVILLVATVLLFFTHNMLNDYIIQIIRNVGGTESSMGYATSLAAFLELPAMATITAISKKVKMNKLLILSGVFFTVKAVIMLLAPNMVLVYISQAMQLLAYAVFIPSSAYYVSENISQNDQVKGQALITSCFTLAGVFSSLVCGAILDNLGVTAMLITGVVVSIIGTITIFIAVGKKRVLTYSSQEGKS